MVTDYVVYTALGGQGATARLLPRAAERWARAAGVPAPERECWRIARTEYGKPYFPNAPEIHVSVTHSRAYWLCAIGARPVGLDLQWAQPVRAAQISARFFHPQEDAFLRAEEYRPFFDVWAAKESYLKFTGEGFRGGMASFAVAGPEGLHSGTEGAQLRRLPFAEGYSLCICAEEIGAVTFFPMTEKE